MSILLVLIINVRLKFFLCLILMISLVSGVLVMCFNKICLKISCGVCWVRFLCMLNNVVFNVVLLCRLSVMLLVLVLCGSVVLIVLSISGKLRLRVVLWVWLGVFSIFWGSGRLKGFSVCLDCYLLSRQLLFVSGFGQIGINVVLLCFSSVVWCWWQWVICFQVVRLFLMFCSVVMFLLCNSLWVWVGSNFGNVEVMKLILLWCFSVVQQCCRSRLYCGCLLVFLFGQLSISRVVLVGLCKVLLSIFFRVVVLFQMVVVKFSGLVMLVQLGSILVSLLCCLVLKDGNFRLLCLV